MSIEVNQIKPQDSLFVHGLVTVFWSDNFWYLDKLILGTK